MFYKGNIEKINKVVVSDPSYKQDVWYRYESDKMDSSGAWRVQLAVNDVSEKVDGFDIKGIDFSLLLSSGVVKEKSCELKKDGSGFTHPKLLNIKEFEIGVDHACVALGINEAADEIKASIGEWKPSCALNTMTDGLFGNVYEGSCYGKTHLLYISGFLDEDTGYSKDNLVNYLVHTFEIKDLELIKDAFSLDEKVAEAKETVSKTPNKKNDKVNDLEI